MTVRNQLISNSSLNKNQPLSSPLCITERENSNVEEKLLIKKFKNLITNSDLVIIADYGHGFFSKKLRDEIYKHNKFLAVNAQVNAFSSGYHTIVD